MFYQSVLSLGAVVLSLSSFATSTQSPVKAEDATTQYFVGSIQPSSLDGKTKYGPAYPSLVKRNVNPKPGLILECTLQQGRMFYTLIQKSEKPLVYSAKDSDGAFNGTLTFADETLSAWSYDIHVLKPTQGQITGLLPQNGAQIDLSHGTLSIRKIWNNQVLISEQYQSIPQEDYAKHLAQELTKNPSISVPDECK